MDIFNPNHYIPRIYLLEEPLKGKTITPEVALDEFSKINRYKLHLPMFKENPYSIITLEKEHNVSLNNQNKIIQFIGSIKGEFTTNFNIEGNCIIALETNPSTEQLLYHNLNFNISKNSSLQLYLFNYEKENIKIKNNIKINLDEDSKVEVKNFSLIHHEQYQDDSIAVTHSSNSSSIIHYRSFTNGITVSQVNSIIPRHAKGATTEQHLKHTMLSEGAKIFSKPNLEISNPDVSASHGNSIGTISEDNVQFLASRGINKEAANRLMIGSEQMSFLLEVQEKMYSK